MLSERRTSSIITFIFLLLMLGFIQFATLGIDPYIYTAYSFWVTLGYRMGLKFLCDKVGNDFMYDRNSNSKENVRTRRIYDYFISIMKLDFDDFLLFFNKNIKIKFYNDYIRKKRNKLIKKSSKTTNERKLAKYDKILKELRADYNIDEVIIKYPQIYHNHFLVEEGSNKKMEYKYQSNYLGAVLKASLKNLSTYLLISVIIGSIVYEFNTSTMSDIGFWVNMGYNGLIVILALSNAMFKSRGLYNSEYKVALENKIRILKNYCEWSDLVTINFNEEVNRIDNELVIEYAEKKKIFDLKQKEDKIKVDFL